MAGRHDCWRVPAVSRDRTGWSGEAQAASLRVAPTARAAAPGRTMFRICRARPSVRGVYRRTPGSRHRLCVTERSVIQTRSSPQALEVHIEMNADEARESPAFSEYARKRARDDMSRPWVALVLLASLSVVSLSLTEAAASVTGLFWAFAGR